jgi:type IV pilus assembly protein PilW
MVDKDMNICCRSHIRRSEGFTLVELMIAMSMSAVVVAAGFAAMIAAQKGAQMNSQITNTQSAGNTGLDMLAADLKLAGFGMDRVTTPIGNCHINGSSSTIVPADNTPGNMDTGPDSISMVIPLTSSVPAAGPLWQVDNPVGVQPGFSSIQVPAGAVTAMQQRGLRLGSVVSMGGAATGVVNAIGGASLGFAVPANAIAPTPFDPQVSFARGTLVYLLQCVTYQVIPPPDPNNLCNGNAPCLVRGVAPVAPLPGAAPTCNVAAAAPAIPCQNVMDGVEDLQLEYACDGCDPRPTANPINLGAPDGQMDDLDQSGSFNYAPNNPAMPGDFISNRNWFLTAAPFGTFMTADKIHLIRVSLVTRQATPDQGLGEGMVATLQTSTPLVVGDHNHATGLFAPGDLAGPNLTAYQQLRRRVMTRTIELRNQRS